MGMCAKLHKAFSADPTVLPAEKVLEMATICGARVLGMADRTAYWPGGFADTHLAGNFTLAGKARWKWANKTVGPEKEWLECSCPMVQEGTIS
jgi:cytosine/adenosine deaminase-related metal-dependent hydrolase